MAEYKPAKTLIARTVLAADAASISFASIPDTYEHLLLVLMGRGNRAANDNEVVGMRFNNDSGANYHFQHLSGRNVTASASVGAGVTSADVGIIPGSTATATRPGSISILIPCYARTVFHKVAQSVEGSLNDASTDRFAILAANLWASSAAINRVDLLAVSNQFIIGTVATLYGYRGA